MKKIISMVLCLAMALSTTTAFADRNADRRKASQNIAQNTDGEQKGLPEKLAKKLNGYLVIKSDEKISYIDGNVVNTGVSAFCENGRFFVPARVVSEYFGYNVIWSAADNTVKIGQNVIYPSGDSKIIDNRTMIDADAIVKYVNANIVYKDEETLILSTKEMAQDTITEVVSALRNRFYVTNDVTVKGDGSIDNPFGGLKNAVEEIRKLTASGMNTNITVYLRGGLYPQENTIVFGPEDSGKNGYTITYKSYPGETAELVAAKPITNWKKDNNGVYTAKIDAKNTVNVLYENDLFAYKARYPNLTTGEFRNHYLESAGYDKNNVKKFYFEPGDIPYIKDTSGLQVTMFGGGEQGQRNWYSETKNAVIDYRKHSLEISWLETYVMGKGSRYFIQGAKELLDYKGEFCYDEVNKTIYYIPYNDDINAQTIVYGTVNSPFNLEGTEKNPVKNLIFEDLKIGKTNCNSEIRAGRNTSIEFKYVDSCSVRNSEILFTGGCGISMLDANNCSIIGNDIHDTGDTAVYLYNPEDYGIVRYRGNRIENNYIHKIGLIHREASGILIKNGDYGTIKNNLIKNTPRTGILFTSEYLPENLVGQTIRGLIVDRDNQFDFRNTIGNYIGYNDVSNILTDSQDAGAIYCYGLGKGNVVDNNHVHDFDVFFSMGYAIYGDDQSSYTTFKNNIVDNIQNTPGAGGNLYAVQVNKGVGSSVVNNFYVNNPNALRGGYSTETKLCDEHNNLTYSNNIMMNCSDQIHGQWQWYDDRFKLCDFNLYYNDSGKYLIYNNEKAKTYEEWKRINTDNGYMDNNSISGQNPNFVDWQNEDFRLRYDSPAYNVGIEDINQRDIGLTEDFKFADREEEIKRIFLETSTDGLSANVRIGQGASSEIGVKARTITGFFANLDNAKITYASTDNNVATVSPNGVITGVNNGIAEITVTAEKNGKTVCSNLFVIVGDDFDGVNAKIAKNVIDKNDTTNIIATAKTRLGYTIPVNNITFKSSNESVATVDEDGKITALSQGVAVISATATVNGTTKTSSENITVLNGVLDKITFVAEKVDPIIVGESIGTKFDAALTTGVKVTPQEVKATYSSDNEAVATVDQNGIIKAMGEGRTNITITLEKDGFRSSSSIAIAVFEKYTGKLADGFKEVNFGTSHGYADFRPDGSILIRSTGDDFYGNADDGYYLYKDITAENADVEIDIKSILETSKNTAVGISVRESATPDSKNYTIRALANGTIISVWRTENNGDSGYTGHGSGKFPIRLKIEKRGSKITSYVDCGEGYTKAYTMKLNLDKCTIGVPVFSQNELSTEAVLNSLTINDGVKK